MASFAAQIDVDADAATTYAYLRDPRNRAEWDSSVRDVTAIGEVTGAVGDRYEVTFGFYGKAIEATCEIVASSPERIVLATSGRVSGEDVIEIAPNGDAATVTLALDVRMKGMARLLDRGLQVAFDGIGENAVSGVKAALG